MSASNLSSISDDQIGCHGDFCVKLSLQPVDNKPTDYNVQAVFEGDEPCSATAYGYTPNGTEYAVCTTVQYGFKPSSNNTWLTVEPQSTQVMQQTKTPEQTQAEAESSGWFRVKLGIGKGFIFRVFPRVLFSACLELTILLPHFCSDTYSP